MVKTNVFLGVFFQAFIFFIYFLPSVSLTLFLCLLSLGAFLAGVPVQPVLLRYPNKLVSGKKKQQQE